MNSQYKKAISNINWNYFSCNIIKKISIKNLIKQCDLVRYSGTRRKLLDFCYGNDSIYIIRSDAEPSKHSFSDIFSTNNLENIEFICVIPLSCPLAISYYSSHCIIFGYNLNMKPFFTVIDLVDGQLKYFNIYENVNARTKMFPIENRVCLWNYDKYYFYQFPFKNPLQPFDIKNDKPKDIYILNKNGNIKAGDKVVLTIDSPCLNIFDCWINLNNNKKKYICIYDDQYLFLYNN